MDELQIYKWMLVRGYLKTAKSLKAEVLAAFEKAERDHYSKKRKRSPEQEPATKMRAHQSQVLKKKTHPNLKAHPSVHACHLYNYKSVKCHWSQFLYLT
ncbi:uncharacterized protein LOC144627956 isoform X2 [Oculina patagonica]